MAEGVSVETGAAKESATRGTADPWRHQLLLRFALLNVVALGLLVLAHAHGLVERAFEADSTRFVLGIVVVFLVGFALACMRIVEVGREIDRARSFDPGRPSLATSYLTRIAGKGGESRQILSASLRLQLSQRIALVRHIASSLVFLGLIGTVIGFIIALSGVDPARAGDTENITPMVAELVRGMSTALVTTLVGGVLNIWLMANYQLLATGTVRLLSAVVELGEDRAGA